MQCETRATRTAPIAHAQVLKLLAGKVNVSETSSAKPPLVRMSLDDNGFHLALAWSS